MKKDGNGQGGPSRRGRRQNPDKLKGKKNAKPDQQGSQDGKVMRHTLGASLNIRHNLSSSKGPKPLQLKLLTTYIPKTSTFTLAFLTLKTSGQAQAAPERFFPFYIL